MAKGSTGTNTSILINTRHRKKRKARPANCKTCKFSRIVDSMVYCTISGDVDVKKRSCKYYSGPPISRPLNHKTRKKAKRTPSK